MLLNRFGTLRCRSQVKDDGAVDSIHCMEILKIVDRNPRLRETE